MQHQQDGIFAIVAADLHPLADAAEDLEPAFVDAAPLFVVLPGHGHGYS